MVLLRCRIAKFNYTPGRQPAFADPPTLHFPPIELRCRKFDRRYPDVSGLLAAKNASRSGGRLSAGVEHAGIRTADKTLPNVGFVVAKNGRFGGGM